MIVAVSLALGIALLILLAFALVARGVAWLGQGHDPAWQPTKLIQKFEGHDQEMGERGYLANLERAAIRRRAADFRAPVVATGAAYQFTDADREAMRRGLEIAAASPQVPGRLM